MSRTEENDNVITELREIAHAMRKLSSGWDDTHYEEKKGRVLQTGNHGNTTAQAAGSDVIHHAEDAHQTHHYQALIPSVRAWIMQWVRPKK